jgi:hypothetical protein
VDAKTVSGPILSCLAQKYICIPAIEAPSERIFSTASLLLSKFRNPDLAGRMVFIKNNLYGMKNSSRRQVEKNEGVWN